MHRSELGITCDVHIDDRQLEIKTDRRNRGLWFEICGNSVLITWNHIEKLQNWIEEEQRINEQDNVE